MAAKHARFKWDDPLLLDALTGKEASEATRLVLPAQAIPMRRLAMNPRVVSTPVTPLSSWRMPVTSQFWMMSTPYWSAPRA